VKSDREYTTTASSTTVDRETVLPNGQESPHAHVHHDLVSFQLDHLSHKFRSNPIPDPRVRNFNPDEWQKQLLDVVDNR
jgi:hypothetical protein